MSMNYYYYYVYVYVHKYVNIVLHVYLGISWLKGNAECLPVADNSYDAYTIAFGIRNTTHIDKVCASQ